MMAVGDVQRRYGPEEIDECLRPFLRDAPHHVLHTVVRGEVVERRGRRNRGNQCVNRGDRAIDQEYRTGLRTQIEQMARAIVFLVAPRPLVFLDAVAIVIVDRIARRDAGLLVTCGAGNATARNVSHSPGVAARPRNCWRARAALAAR